MATTFETGVGFPRGTFYDRNLKQIAVTLDRVSLYARTQELKSVSATVKVLGEILSLDEKELQQKLQSGSLRVWLAEDISMEQEIAIKSKRLSGVYLQKEEKRFYPNGTQAAHLIGYAENGIGLAGVEQYYDRLLASRKRPIEEQVHLSSPQDLVLTLDLKIQDILDKLVEETSKQQKVRQVMAYIMEGRTGQVIAGSQLPGFDPNNFAKFSQEVLANRFVIPVILPDKFRSFLRDVALLHGEDHDESIRLPWSLRSSAGNLGNQLRLWEWLGLNDKPLTDFHMSMQPGEKLEGAQQQVLPQSPFLVMVPEYATPFNILTAFAVLQNEGKTVRPFVVQKSVGGASVFEFSLGENSAGERVGDKSFFNFYDSEELFRSQARQGVANSYFFRDEIPVTILKGSSRHLLINELLLVTIPAGGNDLNLLVMVEREADGPNPKNGKSAMTLEQIVEEKVERISVLQQVAKTVADVVEPESSEDGNYIGDKDQLQAPHKALDVKNIEYQKLTVMPDLRGQSLRKSLRLLQGVYMKISIRGTGKVVSQKPAPGAPLQGVSECTIILEKGEDVIPEKLSKGASVKKQ
ncbi:MAG: PASTA domain-containing protein [Proteobacteria bacterium]|nr:PASTA domain-containing protein [Pseudomonadota bacterium]